MELVGEALGHVIAKLDGSQLHVAAILDVVGRYAALVVGVACGQCRNVAARIGSAPCVEGTDALVQIRHVDGRVGPEVGLRLIAPAVDVHSLHALPEHGQVPVLILQVDVQTPGKVRRRVIDPVLVFLRDTTVAVQVLVAYASKSCTLLYGMVVDLFLALENAVVDVAHL